jgi:hypothetical protein
MMLMMGTTRYMHYAPTIRSLFQEGFALRDECDQVDWGSTYRYSLDCADGLDMSIRRHLPVPLSNINTIILFRFVAIFLVRKIDRALITVPYRTSLLLVIHPSPCGPVHRFEKRQCHVYFIFKDTHFFIFYSTTQASRCIFRVAEHRAQQHYSLLNLL